jgi:hypothetical protein
MDGGQELTSLGWTMLIGSWTAITFAVCYCFYRVLSTKGGNKEDDE